MGSFDFSCTSFSFPKLSLAGAAQVIAAIGIPGIDLCLAEGDRDVDVRRVESAPERAGEDDLAACTRWGLSVIDVFCILGKDRYDHPVNSPDRALREGNRRRFASVVRYATAAGARGITVLPGLKWPQLPDRGFALACEELAWYSELAEKAGLRLSVEPHIESIAPTPTSALELAERVPGLRLTLDYSHFLAAGFEQQAVHPLARYAGHVHIRQAAPGRPQVASREGVLRVDEILDNLRLAGYKGAITIEYVWSPWRGLDQVDVVSESVLLLQELQRFTGDGQPQQA